MLNLHEIGAQAKDLVVEFLDATKQDVRPRTGSISARGVPPQDTFHIANFDVVMSWPRYSFSKSKNPDAQFS